MVTLPVVNEQDEIIEYKERSEITIKNIYRVSALWITNSKGEILLAQRALTKSHHPGRWGPAVAGTVEEEESYEENIIHEAEEEIGLTGVSFNKGPKTRTESPFNHFTQWFTTVIDKPIDFFKIDKREVETIKWWEPQEILNEIKINPHNFLVKIPKYVKLFSR